LATRASLTLLGDRIEDPPGGCYPRSSAAHPADLRKEGSRFPRFRERIGDLSTNEAHPEEL